MWSKLDAIGSARKAVSPPPAKRSGFVGTNVFLCISYHDCFSGEGIDFVVFVNFLPLINRYPTSELIDWMVPLWIYFGWNAIL